MKTNKKELKPYDYAEDDFTPAFFIGVVLIVMVGIVALSIALLLALWVITGVMSIW